MSKPIQPDRRAFVRAAIATMGALAMSDSKAGWFDGGETKPPYPVTTSGLVFGTSSGIQPIFWLDNERAMLPAYAVEHHKGADGRDELSAPPLGIYIWNVKNNTYKRYADLMNSPRLFHYDHGNIAYATSEDRAANTSVVMIGAMGKEKAVVLNEWRGELLEPSMGPSASFLRNQWGGVAITVNLLQRDGYIFVGNGRDIYPNNQNDHVKLYRPGQVDPIDIPILAKEVGTNAKISYSDYLGKYVLIPDTWRGRDLARSIGSWPKEEPYPIYLISPDGKVETIAIPPGLWHPAKAFPTREGLFWVSNTTRTNSRDAGGWLLKDGKVTKLFDQLVDGAGVSPDGCTVVYANNDFNPKTTEYVQAINLCGTQNKK